MAELVLSSVDQGVLTLTFNRPDTLNAWTDAMGRRYFDLLAEAEKDPEVRAVVVTGAGKGFCSGADFKALAAIQNGTYDEEPDPRPNTFPTTVGKPIIAAVNGACAGLGMVHALVCDLVFTAAMIGLAMVVGKVLGRGSGFSSYAPVWMALRVLKSAPEQKPLPAPVTTTQRTAGSCASVSASPSASWRARLKAL